MAVLVVIEALAIGLLGVLVAGLLRSHAEILQALHRLGAGLGDDRAGGNPAGGGPAPQGGPASDLVGVTPSEEPVRIGVMGTAQATLLAFLSSGCTTCAGMWRALREGDGLALLPEGVRAVVVTRSPDQESPSQVAALAPPLVPVVMSSPAWDDYGVPGSPYFVLVDGPGGRVVGEGVASRWDQVVALLGQALADGHGPAQGRGPVPAGVGNEGDGSPGQREARADRELLAAGIHPGHPSLHHPDIAVPPPGPAPTGEGW